MDDHDYESLPSTSFIINMTAGALAGVLEFGLTYPLDSVRTRMQSLSRAKKPSSIYSTLRDMFKSDGILRPMRGVSVVIAGTIPAHALYFGCYELSKQFLTTFTTMKNVNYITSAVVATIVYDAVANPTEVIKQRLQMYDSPYRSVIQCARGVYKTEGLMAFYRSFATQVLMNVPFQAVHFVTYEFFQNVLNHERRYSPLVHVVAGGAAGGAAAAVTTPLDMVKTLLNTQELGFTRGMAEAAKQIYRVAGMKGFFRGISARVVYTTPGTAICWTVYEFFKFYICGLDRDQYKSSVTGENLIKSKDSRK